MRSIQRVCTYTGIFLIFTLLLTSFWYTPSAEYGMVPKSWSDIYSSDWSDTQGSSEFIASRYTIEPIRQSFFAPKSTYLGPDLNYLVFSPICFGHYTNTLMSPIIPSQMECFTTDGDTKTPKPNSQCLQDEKYTLDLLGYHRIQPISWSKLDDLEIQNRLQWVKGVTAIANFDDSNENIAHWAKTVLAFRYLKSNPGFVAISSVDRVVMFMAPFLVGRWKLAEALEEHDPHEWNWAFSALVASLGSTDIELMGYNHDMNEIYNSLKGNLNLIIQGQSVPTDAEHITCFEKVVISGSFRNNLYLTDSDTQLHKCSSEKHQLYVPIESMSFRKTIFDQISKPLTRTPIKKVIYLQRDRNRRAFDVQSESKLLSLLDAKCRSKGYDLQIHSFKKLSFSNQLDILSDASVFMSLHGAGLTNSIFMPPFSVLFEIFPYGWYKRLYKNGMESGIKYYDWNISSGAEYIGIGMYSSHYQCVTENYYCRRFYRDRTDIYLAEEDLKGIDDRLDEMFEYLSTTAPNLYSRDCYENI